MYAWYDNYPETGDWPGGPRFGYSSEVQDDGTLVEQWMDQAEQTVITIEPDEEVAIHAWELLEPVRPSSNREVTRQARQYCMKTAPPIVRRPSLMFEIRVKTPECSHTEYCGDEMCLPW